MGLGVRELQGFGLTLRTLKALGSLQVEVKVALSPKMYDPRLTKLPHAARLALFRALKKRSVAHVLRIWPVKPIGFEGDKDCPYAFRSTVAANLIPALAKDKEIDSIEILHVPGRRRHRVQTPRTLSWYAVRALVAIEVEGQKEGMQTTEDRIVLVKAFSQPDALRRLRGEWQRYQSPSLNSEGYLVRWKLQKILDTYELFDKEIDPKGTEVYSRLSVRRMKREYHWEPFKSSNQAMQPTGQGGG